MNEVMLTAARTVIDVMAANERRHGERWRDQDVTEHVMHAQRHLDAFMLEDTSEPHLEHALTRIAMALTLVVGGSHD